jgi:hypothetical protein
MEQAREFSSAARASVQAGTQGLRQAGEMAAAARGARLKQKMGERRTYEKGAEDEPPYPPVTG